MIAARFHPEAEEEFHEIMAYLESKSLFAADRFELAFKATLQKAKKNPNHYHYLSGSKSLHRASIGHFNRHFLYEINDACNEIRILAIRHDKQHPTHGLDRVWS